jgi:hypothetical protein
LWACALDKGKIKAIGICRENDQAIGASVPFIKTTLCPYISITTLNPWKNVVCTNIHFREPPSPFFVQDDLKTILFLVMDFENGSKNILYGLIYFF